MATQANPDFQSPSPWLDHARAYLLDAAQRGILFGDVMRRRGNNYLAHLQAGQPAVLDFDSQLVLDGRSLERPVNYSLVQILPSDAHPVDAAKRPVVIIDPRAGHGPGIGGSKQDSQVGNALRAGHPVYFVGFSTLPVPGQTLPDVGAAQVKFIEAVRRRHPEREEPMVIGNCQAGWLTALVGAARPDVTGPLVLNGAPLSYWAGKNGINPMRYLGGLVGGVWVNSLLSDLGNDLFDGANLVANFEQLNPANTLWSKAYHLYANIDSEAQRYLDFERWWGGFFIMTAAEIHEIVNGLFIGNKPEQGSLDIGRGDIDLRNLEDPLLVFTSSGDNITPPQQALNWIVKVYGTVGEIRRQQQVIVYLVHRSVGHLGIFVSGSVARKEHQEILDHHGIIEHLWPGLYEMIIDEGEHESGLGDYKVRFEERTMDDIRALDDGFEDERDFPAVAAVSEINDNIYRTLLRPWIRPWITDQTAEIMRQLHPLRVKRYAFSDLNPLMWPFKAVAPAVKARRRPVAADNPFICMEKIFSDTVTGLLDYYRDQRDLWAEFVFKSFYGHPLTRCVLGDGHGPESGQPLDRRALEAEIKADLLHWIGRMEQGGFAEGAIRLLILGISQDAIAHEDEYQMARRITRSHSTLKALAPDEVKRLVREQSRIIQTDRRRAIETLPTLLPPSPARSELARLLDEVVFENRVVSDPQDRPFLKIVNSVLGMKLGQGQRRSTQRKKSGR